ncbi:MAG TPA: efflux RND transporter permease subunit [bacterium]|nr:efflux RND transporter permease subunit [bacterium]
MNALTIFIRRPVLATMLTVLLMVLGLFSYRAIGVDLTPKVEFPLVTITTVLRGASPEEVETLLTKPIEEAVNTVSGIDELSSTSSEGMSRVRVRFLLEKPVDEAVQDVRDKVAAVVSRLPTGVEMPVVTRVDFDAFPVITFAVSGNRDPKELSEITRISIKESLENVAGVGAVNLSGYWRRAVNVQLDAAKMQALGISVGAVKAALTTQNVEVPAGRIDKGEREEMLRVLGRVASMEELRRITVTTRNGRQITLGEIAAVTDSVEEPRNIARLWKKGEERTFAATISLDVVKQSGSNTVEVIAAVKERMAKIQPLLPKDIAVEVVSDQSIFINNSLHELKLHLTLGALFAAIAVFLFLGHLRSTIIAALAIPTSLIATFTFMHLLGFTLNNMSLLGLTLAVGIVIDDAIVVLENIFRHIEQYGKNAFDAAIDGLKEIGLAVTATTTSLLVIFLPIAFMQGMSGRFFYEFGLTTAFAIAVSLLISFTLTPMLAARFLGAKPHDERSLIERFWKWLDDRYATLVRFSLHHRWVIGLVALAVIFSAVPIAKRLGTDFMPLDDRGEIQVELQLPSGVTLESARAAVGAIERDLRTVRGVDKTLMQIGSSVSDDVTGAKIYVALVPLEERDFSQFEVQRDIRRILKRYPEIISSASAIGGSFGGGRSATFQYDIVGPDLDRLTVYSDAIVAKLRDQAGFADVSTSLVARKPEARIIIDRLKAADLGLSVADIAATLRTFVGGEIVTKYREGSEQYDVWLRLDRTFRDDAAALGTLTVPSAKGVPVPLSQVTQVEYGKSPSVIDRFNRQRRVSIYANLDGVDIGTATATIDRMVKELDMPIGYAPVKIGRSKVMAESMQNLLMAFALAFIFIYIVLAAQFESFVHPITILLSLPLTIPFALLSLLMTGETINLYSLLGVFMLFGIVKKNGILQVDYANTLRERGEPLEKAIIEANKARLRPILMTTMTLVAGMIPIALGTGPGAAARASMAKSIVGGQILSLLITLLVVPVGYHLFESVKMRFGFGKRD